MRKYIVIFLVAVVAISIIALGIYRQEKESLYSKSGKEIIRIGVIAPQTGDLARFGQDVAKGVELFFSSIPNSSKYEYKLYIEDDQNQAKRAVSAANKLIQVNKVDVIITTFGASLQAVVSVAIKHKVLVMEVSWDQELPKNKYVMVHMTQPKEINGKLKDELLRRNQIKLAGLFLQIPETTYEHVVEAIKDTPIELISVKKIQPGSRDFSMIAQELAQKKPDAILLDMPSPELDIFMQKYRTLNKETVFVGTGTYLMTSPHRELLENAWLADNATANKQFYIDFENKFQTQSLGMSPFTYDMVGMLYHVYEKHDAKPNIDIVIEDLQNIKDYNSIFGKLWVDEYGVFHSEPSVKMIKNGQIEVVEE